MALAAGLAMEWERAYPKAFPERNDSNARKMKTMRGKVTCLWQHFATEESRKNATGFEDKAFTLIICLSPSYGFVIEKLHGFKFSNGWHGHRYWLARGFNCYSA